MPTARELLEQADALMRRNRMPEEPPAAPPVAADEEIPELIEATLSALPVEPADDLDVLLHCDGQARRKAGELLTRMGHA